MIISSASPSSGRRVLEAFELRGRDGPTPADPLTAQPPGP